MGNRIITIGRQFGSNGRNIGRAVAEKLGVNFYDKELLKLAAEKSGVCEELLQNLDEKPNKSLENQKILEKNNSINTDKRIKITKSLRRYNYNFKNDLIDVAHMSKEDKFREFKMQFDEKLNEIKGPMQFIKLRKKQLNI